MLTQNNNERYSKRKRTIPTWPSSTELEKAWDLGYKAGFCVFKREGCQTYNRKMGSLIELFFAY